MQTPFGKNIVALRNREGLTQQALADLMQVAQTTVSGWETRGQMPRTPQIEELKQRFNLSSDDLLSEAAGLHVKLYGLMKPKTSDTFAPVAGMAAAGDPRLAMEDATEQHWVPPHIAERWPDGFFVRVSGDSMDRTIPDGAFAFVAPGEPCNGHIALVKVNGDDATVKRVKIVDDLLLLQPESTNDAHKRRIIDKTDPDAPEVRLIGRVVWMDSNL